MTMRALSIRQPWAWAILTAGKDVENRSWPHRPHHQGPLLIHAGKARPTRAMRELVGSLAGAMPPEVLPFGAYVGACIVDRAHHADDCRLSCSRWAEPGVWHLPILDPRPLGPIKAGGQLGFWQPSMFDELLDAMRAAARDGAAHRVAARDADALGRL